MPIPLFIFAAMAAVKVFAVAAGAAAVAAAPVIVAGAGIVGGIVEITKLVAPLFVTDEETGKERLATRAEEEHHIAGLYAT